MLLSAPPFEPAMLLRSRLSIVVDELWDVGDHSVIDRVQPHPVLSRGNFQHAPAEQVNKLVQTRLAAAPSSPG